MAPDFMLQALDNNPITLSELRGKVVLVNIWASWCAPCRIEMPAIEKVYRQYRESGFVAVAINTTFQDSQETATSFVRSLGLSFPILFDFDGTVSRRYAVQALPTSFLVGRDGIIREVILGGAMNEALIASKIQPLLAEGTH